MKKEKVSIGGRFAASFVMFLSAFVTALVVWFLVFFFSATGGSIFTFPFIYIFYFSGVFVIFAFFSPNRSIDCMGWIWKKMENFFKDLNRGDP